MEREEEAPAVNALVFPISTISGNAISLAISTFGVSLSVSFLFSPRVRASSKFLPFVLIKPGACYTGYNNLKRNQAIVSQIVF